MPFGVKSPGTLFSDPMSRLSEDRAVPISCLSVFMEAMGRPRNPLAFLAAVSSTAIGPGHDRPLNTV